jgi:hypothetical protein
LHGTGAVEDVGDFGEVWIHGIGMGCWLGFELELWDGL